jgi:hypothetical protein
MEKENCTKNELETKREKYQSGLGMGHDILAVKNKKEDKLIVGNKVDAMEYCRMESIIIKLRIDERKK